MIYLAVVLAVLTPRSRRPSSLWRGIIVTSSISHKKATSGGVTPGGSDNAISRFREYSSSGDARGPFRSKR